MDPAASAHAKETAETGEEFIVRINSTHGGLYWFTDRRVLQEELGSIRELLRYRELQRVYWMFKDVGQDPRMLSQAGDLKRQYFDRLEIETLDNLVVLDGLEQAYLPIFNFVQWIIA